MFWWILDMVDSAWTISCWLTPRIMWSTKAAAACFGYHGLALRREGDGVHPPVLLGPLHHHEAPLLQGGQGLADHPLAQRERTAQIVGGVAVFRQGQQKADLRTGEGAAHRAAAKIQIRFMHCAHLGKKLRELPHGLMIGGQLDHRLMV